MINTSSRSRFRATFILCLFGAVGCEEPSVVLDGSVFNDATIDEDAGVADADPVDVGRPVCSDGTVLDPVTGQCVPVEECPPGQRKDENGVCQPFDPCLGIDCNAVPKPVGVDTLEAQAVGTACVCVATACVPGYLLLEGTCVAVTTCNPGYRQEGELCVLEEDVSCYDAPRVPFCIPTRCAEQPTAADGTDLVALGKCVVDPPPPPESCTNNCHFGTEDAHPWFGGPELSCTGCHGGDPGATTRETAHVPMPAVWQPGSPQWGRPNLRYYWNYLTLAGVENFDGGLEWLRFRNPGDLRVTDQTCGKNSGCHQVRAENVSRSVMATSVGPLAVSQASNAVQRLVVRDPDAVYKWDSTQGMTLGAPQLDAFASDPSLVGSVDRIVAFNSVNRESFGAYDQIDILQEVYDKECGRCHLGNAGMNNRTGDFRSSGCTACHGIYARGGRSVSADQMISKNEPTIPTANAQIANFDPNDLLNSNGSWLGPERPHPRYHRLAKSMGSIRCGTCHSGSNHTDWQFRGYQIDPNRTVATAAAAGLLSAQQFSFTDEIDNDLDPFALYHGLAEEQILRYVDWNGDGFDDIPADIHWQAGLECMDCHTTGEVHNEVRIVKVAQVTDWSDPNQVTDMSGALWSHMDQATEVECVHCHGNLEFRAVPHEADNRNPIRRLIACPELGETIPNYTTPPECATLGRGRWLLSKFGGNWHYTPQTRDTVDSTAGPGVGATFPNGAPVYTLNASIFHGRFNASLEDGVGPCPQGNAQNCFRDQANSQFPVAQEFSHLGAIATRPGDQMEGGLECYACHSTWANNCYGCHLRLGDTDGSIVLYGFTQSTGERTLGQVVEADYTAISPLDMQYGINGEGKISQFLPEAKQAVAHTDAMGNSYFGTQVIVNNDSNIEYNIYRDRAGYGLRQYATDLVGLPPNADGLTFDQAPQMDLNAGQGAQPMMPHSVQRSHPLMDCTLCHLDANDFNADAIAARYMYSPTGFATVSEYLSVLENVGITRRQSQQTYNVDAQAGFRFDANTDPEAFVVDRQSDWCVSVTDGFPLCSNMHPMREGHPDLTFDPAYSRAYPGSLTVDAHIAGPLNVFLLNKLSQQVVVGDENVQLRGPR